jgi:hypothetical protein
LPQYRAQSTWSPLLTARLRTVEVTDGIRPAGSTAAR